MKNHDLFKRGGRFFLPKELIEERPFLVQFICSTVVIVRAELMYLHNGIDYEGFCSEWDLVDDFRKAPIYKALITENNTFTGWQKYE